MSAAAIPIPSTTDHRTWREKVMHKCDESVEVKKKFFEQYADLLADIYIPHPHGGRAIPISERQILTLREPPMLPSAALPG